MAIAFVSLAEGIDATTQAGKLHMHILGAIADAAGVGSGDTVIEVGPGRGSLTTILAERAARVVALEIDRELVDALRPDAGANVEVLHADARRADPAALLVCFQRYMAEGGHRVTRAQFEANLHGKRADPSFRADIQPLLRSGVAWDFDLAMDGVLERVVAGLPGDGWKGS